MPEPVLVWQVPLGPHICAGGQPPHVPWQPSLPQVLLAHEGAQAGGVVVPPEPVRPPVYVAPPVPAEPSDRVPPPTPTDPPAPPLCFAELHEQARPTKPMRTPGANRGWCMMISGMFIAVSRSGFTRKGDASRASVMFDSQ